MTGISRHFEGEALAVSSSDSSTSLLLKRIIGLFRKRDL